MNRVLQTVAGRCVPVLARTLPVALALVVSEANDASAWAAPSPASAAEASPDVQQEVDRLRAEIEAYRATRATASVDAERRADIRGLVEDVLADADARVSYQDDAFVGGWKKGFRLQSPDGNFSLKIAGQVQIRYVVNHREGDQDLPNNPAGTLWGMENRRTKLKFSGHVVDPTIKYKIQVAYLRFTGGVPFLEEGYLAKDLGNGFEVQVGQFKAPFTQEWLVSSTSLLAVDRSIVDAYFRPGYAQGVQLGWTSDRVRGWLWCGDGLGAVGFGDARTNSINTPWYQTRTRWATTARVEWCPEGSWGLFKDYTSRIGSDSGVMVGFAAMGQQLNGKVPGTNDLIAWGMTTDVSVEFGGANLFASLAWEHNEPTSGPAANPWGATIQGGVFVSESLEVFGRYSYLNYDTLIDPQPDTGRYDGFTVGLNWFFNPDVKFTLDWGINFASLVEGSALRRPSLQGIGYRSDEPDHDHQWALRAQVQLLF